MFSKNCFEESDVSNKKNSERNHHLCSPLFFNAYFLQKMDNSCVVEYGVIHELVTKKSKKEVRSFFITYVNKFDFLQNIFMELSQDIANENSKKRMEVILRELFFLGQKLYENLLDKYHIVNDLLKKILELIRQILNKFSQEDNFDLLSEIFSSDTDFCNIYKFILYFIICTESFYKDSVNVLPSNSHFKYEDFILLKNNLIQKLNENRTKVVLFDKTFEDVVFTFYNGNSQDDIERYYKEELKETEVLIHLCLFFYHNKTSSKVYNSIDEIFSCEFSKIASVQNRFSEIIEYINKGEFKKLPEMCRGIFAKFIHEMDISYNWILEQKIMPKNKLILENWNELEKFVEKK